MNPIAVTSSHSAPVTPAMYSSGEMPSDHGQAAEHQADQADPARHAALARGENSASPARPASTQHHGMVPIQWLYIAALRRRRAVALRQRP